MDVNSANNSGLLGIQRGMQGLERNASEIASATAKQSDQSQSVTDSLVESESNQLQAEASAKVVQTADEALGTILDEMA
ncbi:MAG TPA: hypothetical protein VKA64_00335 [Gammaproteobacteria bacterium]|nr:hypothetical protein [Gammaproteobacteria bacterium]